VIGDLAFAQGDAMKICVCLAMIGIQFIGTAAIARAEDKPKVVFDEKFTSPLSAGWHWVREDPKAWKVENGKLLLRSLPGDVYTASDNNARNFLLRKAPVTSHALILEVFLENQPKTHWELAGLYFYYDDDNYVCLLKEQVPEEVQVRMFNEIDAEPTHAGEARYDTEGVWLRLVIKGDKARGYYRQTDKQEWRGMGQLDLPSKGEPKVGINAGGGPEDAERWVRFSQYRILEQADAVVWNDE
jgi:beta-xylosidase